MTLPPELQQRFDHVCSHIFFDWDGEHYSIPFEAYPIAEYVYLPDKDVTLKVLAWQEVMPPIPHFRIAFSPNKFTETNRVVATVDYTDHLG